MGWPIFGEAWAKLHASNIAKIEAGEFHLRKTETDVEEIVSNALQRTTSLAANHQLKVNILNNAKISADSKSISEVIYNLIDNAVKYSPNGSTITVSAKTDSGYLEISVENEGKAIPVEEHNKIFQKFYRVNKSAKGFGMGLAIARGIIEAHGGRIWVESGKIGSRFVFELPIDWWTKSKKY